MESGHCIKGMEYRALGSSSSSAQQKFVLDASLHLDQLGFDRN